MPTSLRVTILFKAQKPNDVYFVSLKYELFSDYVIARCQLKIQTGVNDEKQHLLNLIPVIASLRSNPVIQSSWIASPCRVRNDVMR